MKRRTAGAVLSVGRAVKTFREIFLERTRLGLDLLDSAKQGRLPGILNDAELGVLICDGVTDSRALPDKESVMGKLRIACLRGELKAELSDRDLYGLRSASQTYCYIHRDDARRYFAGLGLEPVKGSALWCWLRGKTAEEAGKLSLNQQDKADFQQRCLEIWGRNPTMLITGEFGVTRQPGETLPYLKKNGGVAGYAQKTLEAWAREVAPDGVKNRRGRPSKISASVEK